MAVVDDGAIGDDACLLRRIHPNQIVNDKNSGMCRPSSAAFKDPEMSVDAETLLYAQGFDWRFSLSDNPDYSVVRFFAAVAREQGQAVIHKPVPGNEAHCEVVGKKSQGVAKAFVAASDWVRVGTKGLNASDCAVPDGVATELE